MKTLFIAAAIALLVSACAGGKILLKGANTVMKIPQARQDLENYLPAENWDKLEPQVSLVDETVQKFDRLLAGDADISFRDAVLKTFGSIEKARSLERAHLAIKSATIQHHTASKEPIPITLVDFNTELEANWKAGKELLTGNDTGAKLSEYLELIGPIAIRVAVKAATGGLVESENPPPLPTGVHAWLTPHLFKETPTTGRSLPTLSWTSRLSTVHLSPA